ncbi:LysM peptidoglycan-binding domain-containing protein [uncultured Gemella sp.]|uniref:LysM peptidoglycan-binding domain-containing protein n=1 Tax=uncultured Gemella sp. TaxID=254352 RepID=UPI0028D7D81A|nr:LysM peptidoglycan-binding domain-containing protein [uncultured Gemella sp.]
MKKNTIKNTVLVVLFIILAPLILIGVTTLGNSLGGKSKDKVVQTTEQAAKVPEETKAESNNNIPKANETKVTDENTTKKEKTNNKSEKTETEGVVSVTPVAGQDYIVKSGDSLFTIASIAYGEANSQSGVEKIKEANNISNNNIAAGQKLQIPKI